MAGSLFNYAGLVLGAFSILATIYFALKYAERKEPRFYSVNESKIRISEDADEHIQITYKTQRVTRVSSTLIWFWNAGKRPIRREDVPTGQSLLVRLSEPDTDIEILDVAIRKASRDAINFAAAKYDSSNVKLDFDFLDFNDGAAIEIQHTGSRSTNVTVSGVILGASKGIRMVSRASLMPWLPVRFRRSRRSKVVRAIATAMLLAVFGGPALFVLRVTPGEITTSRDLVRAALEDHLTGDSVASVIQSVEASAKYRTLNKFGPYFFAALFTLNLLWGLAVLWRSPVAFPSVLLIDDTRRKDDTTERDNT